MDSVTRCPCVKEKSVADIIKEVKTEICDYYCKYPEHYDDDEILLDVCEKCPLNKL